MMKKQNYRIERLSNDNIHDLIPLFLATFNKKISPEFITQKFNTCFTNFSNIGFIAYCSNNQAIAFYGVLPCYANINGKKMLVAQSGDTMTHPKHRRSKLFVQLAEQTFKYCEENGFNAIFGFPNIYSFAGFIKKLKWKHFDDYHSFSDRVLCFPWIRIKKWFPFLKNLHLKVQKNVLSKLQDVDFFNNSIDNKHPHIIHDKEFIDYKKFQNSYIKKIGDASIWFKTSEIYLMVGDISTLKNFKKTHNSLKKIAFILGIPHIRYQISSQTDLFKTCSENKLVKGNTYPIAGIALNKKFPLDKMKFTLADFDTF